MPAARSKRRAVATPRRATSSPTRGRSRRSGSGLWLQQFGWSTSKSVGDTANYKVSGWGAAGGFERAGRARHVGLTLHLPPAATAKATTTWPATNIEGGVLLARRLWSAARLCPGRGRHGQFRRHARLQRGDRRRPITAPRKATGTGGCSRRLAGASYEPRSGRFSVRPSALDRLHQAQREGL